MPQIEIAIENPFIKSPDKFGSICSIVTTRSDPIDLFVFSFCSRSNLIDRTPYPSNPLTRANLVNNSVES